MTGAKHTPGKLQLLQLHLQHLDEDETLALRIDDDRERAREMVRIFEERERVENAIVELRGGA